MEICPACQGEVPDRNDCGTCQGVGAVDLPDPRKDPERWRESPDEAPEWVGTCSGVLSAWAAISRHGVDGWMKLAGITEVDPMCEEALAEIQAEYSRLEHGARVAEAKKTRRKKD